MSSSSSYTNNYLQHNGDERCNCGRKAVMRPSLTVKNPGRRFLGCVNYKKDNGCNFFVWVDPETCERGLEYAKIMQAKKEELERQIEGLKMMNNELGRGMQKLEKENDALFVKLAELTEINAKLVGQARPRKTTNRLTNLTTLVVVVIVVFVVCVLMSSVKHTHGKKPLYLV
ncbi:hypothetical protein RHGRI_021249 [Rhododendron griersonianum]|uniref:GRF-type domain-containing protein n=1 Tax=Rhododendron griersonianum TaxID=479676 RepID=A0AAV6JMY1_9ERIC|nr:hypothetical protein RHGRI_021249 [Rhododendron griersonianum]